MCGENRSPILGSYPCRSSEDGTRTEKGGAAGPAAHKMDCGPTSTRSGGAAGPRDTTHLSFGVSSPAEVFQDTIQGVLAGLPGVLNISNDILIHHSTVEEHLESLRTTFQCFLDNSLTLHREKCAFLQKEISFFRYKFSEHGVMPVPAKVQDIRSAPAPTSITGEISFLGMVTYFGCFIPNLTVVTVPLRVRTKSIAIWESGPSQDQAFQAAKEALSENIMPAYFNPCLESELSVEARPTIAMVNGSASSLAEDNYPSPNDDDLGLDEEISEQTSHGTISLSGNLTVGADATKQGEVSLTSNVQTTYPKDKGSHPERGTKSMHTGISRILCVVMGIWGFGNPNAARTVVAARSVCRTWVSSLK
ncbi:hypothetical protein NDU88_002893 [Pleurodeles waltl]|uniref:Uncharacterized protein n=1 Tax=Pleurodeles waltl TaxID=8319 RepID=A0AAV7PAP3_PLEWA|nr:hypothetical protein NDU88_002893 [Pleurodeles waltl]